MENYSFSPAMKNHIKQINDGFNRTQYPRPLLDKILTFVLFFMLSFKTEQISNSYDKIKDLSYFEYF